MLIDKACKFNYGLNSKALIQEADFYAETTSCTNIADVAMTHIKGLVQEECER